MTCALKDFAFLLGFLHSRLLIFMSNFFHFFFSVVQLLREISHENVVKLVNVHINQVDMSLYLAFDYAEHDLYVSYTFSLSLSL